jgi:hypothetical protein
LSEEATAELHHALFGYAGGHRQIAASVRIPSRDMYHLAAASDLASNVSLAPGQSYLTGIPLEESGRYALIRTWPAPEMPRPGCVWSHVLLLDQKFLTTCGDLTELLGAFRAPLDGDTSFYSAPLQIGNVTNKFSPPDTDIVAKLIANYYAGKPAILRADRNPDALETSILSVWSQQWPRLRSIFSFRTAVMTGRWKASSYDVFVATSQSSEFFFNEEWVAAGVTDAVGRSVTPLRRFLWRYGRDIASPRARYRNLVEIFLVSRSSPCETPLELARRVFEELPDTSDGEILKRDLLGIGTTSLSLCPPVSFVSMLLMIQDERLVPLIHSADLYRRLYAAPLSELVTVANMAGDRSPEDDLWRKLLDGVTERADAELLQSELNYPIRLRILLDRDDLIDFDTLSALRHEDFPTLLRHHTDQSVRRTILQVALRQDMGPESATLLAEDPTDTFMLAIDAQRSGELHDSWRNPIRSYRDLILGANILYHIESFGDLATAVFLLGAQTDLRRFDKNVARWSALLPKLKRDASEGDVLQLFASLLAMALQNPCVESWSIVAQTLPELRANTLRGQLPNDTYLVLDRSLPHLRRGDDWDLDKRMLLALRRLQEKEPASNATITSAGLSGDEKDFVLHGPKENGKKSMLFWWL